MAEMWYYTCEGKQMDPVTMREMKRLVGDGMLKPTDMVWKEGMPRWIRASSLTELFPDPISALDQYFTNTSQAEKKDPLTTGVAVPAGNSAAPAAASTKNQAVPKADEEAPQKKKRKASESAEEEDASRPPRRRPEAKSGGGSGLFIIIALVFGAFVLLGALAGGVILLIVMSRPGPVGNPIQPMVIDPKNEPANLIKGEKNYNVQLAPGARESQNFIFRKGVAYEITVKTLPQFPGVDVDLFVYDKNGNQEVGDDGPGPDCFVRFTPRENGEYRVELANVDGGQNVQSAVKIRDVSQPPPKEAPKDPPLPQGVLQGNGAEDSPMLKPNGDFVMRFRVKARHQASIKVTALQPNADFNLYVYNDSNRADINPLASDTRPDANANVSFSVPNTEIVRVRIHNNTKMPQKCTVFYDVGP
jgi:hypothetical protein